MAESHNPPLEHPLRVGLIADGEGVAWLSPALKTPVLEVAAQGGMPDEDAIPDVEYYEDVRAMLAQAGLEAVLVATSTRAAVEWSAMAAERGLAVWRPAPLARNFGRAVDVLRNLPGRPWQRVASWWEFVAEHVRWALDYGEGVKPAFSHIRVSAPGPSVKSWRASTAEAPGGVLATDAYGMLEALLAIRKLPARVSAVVANVRRRPGEAPRETEDVATAVLRYGERRAAAIHATWDVPPYALLTEHHGSELTVTLTPDAVAVRSRDGEILAERRLEPQAFLRRELERFVSDVRRPPDPADQRLTLERHLAVTALLDSIYLSTRTGQPECPARLYEAQKWPQR